MTAPSRNANALLLGVVALLALLIALLAAAIRVFNNPPLADLAAPSSQAAEIVVVREESATMRAAAPREQPVAPPSPKPQSLSSRARVVDTATIELDGRAVRLKGVRGEGGAHARELESWIGGRTVACIRSIADRHVCEVDGYDLAEVVLFNGGGRATADASVALRRAERQARDARRGAWRDVDARLAPDVRRR